MSDSIRWVVVTGISGSGRTTALHALEDVGFYCVDNLPASLLSNLHDEMAELPDPRSVAVGIDVRGDAFLDDIGATLDTLLQRGVDTDLLFLDCSDEMLLRRFAETRRRHPILSEGTIIDSIRTERARMLAFRERTTLVIDTSELNPHQLKALIQRLYADTHGGGPSLLLSMMSFGFKHGLPRNPDYVFDVRCLKNPHFVAELRPLTGQDEVVRRYVLDDARGAEYLELVKSLLNHSLPRHVDEGRAAVTVAFGCTGGQHRSVAMAIELAEHVRTLSIGRVTISHRDLEQMSSS
jgi:UPF0042 nucleotide-binding protein